MIDGIGRKPLLIFCNFLSGVACIAAAFTHADEPVLAMILTLAGIQ